MANVPAAPFVLKNMLATIGADTFQETISSLQFVPTASQQTWKGGGGNVHTDVDIAAWAVALTLAQDWETPGSLAQYLLANEGQTVAITFRPKSGSGPSFAANIVVTPGAIGGAVGVFQESTVTLGSSKPVLVPVSATPVVTSSDVVTGPAAGGNLVKVFGTRLTGATAVKFGSVNATVISVVSDSAVVALAPAQAAGSKPISVVTPGGTSGTTPYSYV